MVTKNATIDPNNAKKRVKLGLSSRPRARIKSPTTMGTKIASVSQGKVEDAISLAIIKPSAQKRLRAPRCQESWLRHSDKYSLFGYDAKSPQTSPLHVHYRLRSARQ